MPDLPARARNTILAGALGDAWGGPYGGRNTPQRALFEGTRTLSDDTWLTLATCEAIARHGGGLGAGSIADVFLEWYAQKRFRALGSATLNVIRGLAAGTGARTSPAAQAVATGGVALRAAPLAFVLDPGVPSDQERLRSIVRITHDGDEAFAGAMAMLEAIRACLSRASVPEDLPLVTAARLPHSTVRDRLIELARISSWSAEASNAEGPRLVEEAVPLAIAIAARAGDTLEGALRAAAIDADADIVAALTGQIVGAAGHAVPAALVAELPEREDVEQIVQRFVQSVVGAVT